MNLMFLNTLEKRTEQGESVLSAQVSIGESHGTWFAYWNETEESGKPVQESWYEGLRWDELLAAFRSQISEKLALGYRPIVSMSDGALDLIDRRTLLAGMLQYYAETEFDEQVYEQLRLWRLKQSSKENKTPFIIASNRMLKMISTYLPRSEEELQQLPGFGKLRAAAYAADITEITSSIDRSHAFPLHWIEQAVDRSAFQNWLYQEKERRIQAESAKRELKKKVLEAASSASSMEAAAKAANMGRRELILMLEELHREGYDLQQFVVQALTVIDEAQKEQALEVFMEQGDRYLKPVVQVIYPDRELSGKEADLVYEWLRLLRMKYRNEQPGDSEAQEAS